MIAVGDLYRLLLFVGRMGMGLVNLTPHEITIFTDEGRIVLPPSGTVARCETKREMIGVLNVDGVTVGN